MVQELELLLGHLEQIPYRHRHAVIFLSYLYQHPEVVATYLKVINLALSLIQQCCQNVTDEPAIYAYQTAALMAHFTQAPLPAWTGIPTGEVDSVAWLILQYYPSLSEADKRLTQQWASEHISTGRVLAYDTCRILQYLAYVSS